jgi:AcrR family transcriptional regulator
MRFIHEEMKVPEKIAEETRPKRDAILDAARTLFAKQGYEETTIAGIAGAAGVAVGTVYLYFRNKHEVYTAVALDFEATIAAVFQDPTLFKLPFEEALDAMVDAIFRESHAHKDLMALLQIDMRSSEEILQHKHTNERVTQAIAAILQRAIDQGQLAPCNTEMYAQLLNLLGSSVMHQCFAVEKGERELLYRQYLTELIERLFFGPSLREGQQGA